MRRCGPFVHEPSRAGSHGVAPVSGAGPIHFLVHEGGMSVSPAGQILKGPLRNIAEVMLFTEAAFRLRLRGLRFGKRDRDSQPNRKRGSLPPLK